MEMEAGPSGLARKRTRSRSHSSSSSDSSSSSSSSNSETRRQRRKRSKRSRKSRQAKNMDKLFREIGELRKQIIVSNNCENHHDHDEILTQVSGELYEQNNCLPADHECPNTSNLDFTFNIETKLKEPSVPKTSDFFLEMLNDVQRLNSTSWSEVRYAETQKTYNHTPGFIDLETNEEVKMYDTLRHLAHSDKAYAAFTYCILKQKVAFQEAIKVLLSWARENTNNFEQLTEKVEEVFQKGDFHKISSDLLQLACGHRAETIEMRRESITKQARDPLVKASLNKIPPSATHLFNTEQFTSALEKAGGVRKAFWPKKDTHSKSYANESDRRPSRGQGNRYGAVPSRGTTRHEQCSHTCQHDHYNPPSRGGYQHYQRTNNSCKGPSSKKECDRYENTKDKDYFRNRGSRPDRGNYRGRQNTSKSSRGNGRN